MKKLFCCTLTAMWFMAGAGSPDSPAGLADAASAMPTSTVSDQVTIYKTLAITNKPTTIPIVEAGQSAPGVFTVDGGSGNYTWRVKGPDNNLIPAANGDGHQRTIKGVKGPDNNLIPAVDFQTFGGTGARFIFAAPRLDHFLKYNFKAGLYTVLATDTQNPEFTDSFQVYVPIKLIAINTADGEPVKVEDIIPPVFLTSAVNPYKLYAAGGGETVNAVIVPVQSSTAVIVADNDTRGRNPFKVRASAPGAAVVTVQDGADTAGNYKGSLRLEVLGVGNATGTVSNYPLDYISPNDITVQLLDPASKRPLPVPRSVKVGADGSFMFHDMPWGSYWARIVVRDNDSRYAPFMEEARVMINQTGTVNLGLQTGIFNLSGDLCGINDTYSLEVALQGIRYNDSVGYKLINVDSNAVSRSNDSVDVRVNNDSLTLNGLLAGDYRLFILSRGYTPLSRYTQNNEETGVIRVNDDHLAPSTNDSKTVTVTGVLTPQPSFVPDPPRVNVSHLYRNGGFDLRVVKNNFAAAFTMAIEEAGAMNPDSGSGNDSAPYLLHWNSSEEAPYTEKRNNTPNTGDTTYVIAFIFKDGARQIGKKYMVTYVEFAGAANKEIAGGNDSAYQDERALRDAARDTTGIQDEYTGETLFIILGEREFFPLEGASFAVTLKDASGADTPVTVEIPPLPLEYLFIDDSDDGNGLLYDSDSDQYGVATDNGALHVQEDDALRVEIRSYTFGGEAIGNGVSIELRRTSDDKLVRYNPILPNLTIEGADLRQNVNGASGAPVVTLPLLLNPSSSFFSAFKKLSESKAKIKVMVSEKGDGTKGFHIENVDLVVQDNGLVLIDTKHLSSWGLGTGDDEGAVLINETNDHCFIATAAYGSLLEPQVATLRQFRDEYLLTNGPGQAFVAAYYTFSPSIASYIADHEGVRQTVRVALTPLVGVSWLALHTTLIQKVLLFTVLAAFLGGGVNAKRRRR